MRAVAVAWDRILERIATSGKLSARRLTGELTADYAKKHGNIVSRHVYLITIQLGVLGMFCILVLCFSSCQPSALYTTP